MGTGSNMSRWRHSLVCAGILIWSSVARAELPITNSVVWDFYLTQSDASPATEYYRMVIRQAVGVLPAVMDPTPGDDFNPMWWYFTGSTQSYGLFAFDDNPSGYNTFSPSTPPGIFYRTQVGVSSVVVTQEIVRVSGTNVVTNYYPFVNTYPVYATNVFFSDHSALDGDVLVGMPFKRIVEWADQYMLMLFSYGGGIENSSKQPGRCIYPGSPFGTNDDFTYISLDQAIAYQYGTNGLIKVANIVTNASGLITDANVYWSYDVRKRWGLATISERSNSEQWDDETESYPIPDSASVMSGQWDDLKALISSPTINTNVLSVVITYSDRSGGSTHTLSTSISNDVETVLSVSDVGEVLTMEVTPPCSGTATFWYDLPDDVPFWKLNGDRIPTTEAISRGINERYYFLHDFAPEWDADLTRANVSSIVWSASLSTTNDDISDSDFFYFAYTNVYSSNAVVAINTNVSDNFSGNVSCSFWTNGVTVSTNGVTNTYIQRTVYLNIRGVAGPIFFRNITNIFRIPNSDAYGYRSTNMFSSGFSGSLYAKSFVYAPTGSVFNDLGMTIPVTDKWENIGSGQVVSNALCYDNQLGLGVVIDWSSFPVFITNGSFTGTSVTNKGTNSAGFSVHLLTSWVAPVQ